MLILNKYFYKNNKSKLCIGDRVDVLNDIFYEYGGSSFIYPFVVTNKLPYLFQATRCRTPACRAVSPGGQPARRDSSEGSHDTLLVRLLPPQCASGPLEAGDPHVPLNH
jgi:hypothetical protein